MGTARRVREERRERSEEMAAERREVKSESSGKGERRVVMLRERVRKGNEVRRRK